jgi:hypothetical protein
MAKIIKVKNNKVTGDTWAGLLLAAGAEYTLSATEYLAWSTDAKVLADAATGDLGVGDGVTYLTTGSLRIDWLKGNPPVSAAGIPLSEPAVFTGVVGTKSISIVSSDFGDRTSWYQKSVQVVDEVLTDSGNGLTWTSVNANWVNIDNARLTYTHKQIPKRDGTFGKHADWRTIVKVDDVVQTTGYTQNFAAGSITFGASKAGTVVKCTYWHNSVANPSEWLLAPPSGKKLVIQHVELQFSVGTVLTDTVRFEIWAGASIGTYGTFSDGLWEAGYGQFRADYRSARDIINAANQGQGTIPAIGELTQAIVVMPFNYVQAITLDSALGTLFRMVLLNNTPFTDGELCTATFYIQIV